MPNLKIDPVKVYDALKNFMWSAWRERTYPYSQHNRRGWHLLVPKYLIEPISHLAYMENRFNSVASGGVGDLKFDGFEMEPGYQNSFVLFFDEVYYYPNEVWDQYIFTCDVPIIADEPAQK